MKTESKTQILQARISCSFASSLITILLSFAIVWGDLPSVSSESSVPKKRPVQILQNSKRTTETTRIGFGSCHKAEKARVPSIWEVMTSNNDNEREESSSETRLDAFVWTGDSVYASHRDPITGKKRYGPTPVQDLEYQYEQMKTNATIGYANHILQRSPRNNHDQERENAQHRRHPIPVYGTWDDHDFGGNDFGRHMPNQKKRRTMFWEFLGYSNLERSTDNITIIDEDVDNLGVYHSVDIVRGGEEEYIGDENDDSIKIILLDTRSFRDDHCIPSVAHLIPFGNAIACVTRWMTAGLNLWKYAKLWGHEKCERGTILGEDQWQWLEEELFSSRADLNIIVSSIQIWTTNPAMESWGHFPKEQQRLRNLLEKHYQKSSSEQKKERGPVIFLSGDVHHGEISGQVGYIEVTSSGLTHHCGQPKLYGKLCRPLLKSFSEHRFKKESFYIGLNYGLISVDWAKRIARIEVKDINGLPVLNFEQPLGMESQIHIPEYDDFPNVWNGHLIPYFQTFLLSVVVSSMGILVMTRRHRQNKSLHNH